jgi:hypothetical protein
MLGCVMGLVAAAVFSGGEVKLSALVFKIEAVLPSFGKGLKDLREALRIGHSLKAGYGIRPKVVQLMRERSLWTGFILK